MVRAPDLFARASELPLNDRCNVGGGRRELGCRGYGGGNYWLNKWWCEFHAPPEFYGFRTA